MLFKKDKNSVAELVLLAIFMSGIFFAWVLVTFRARVHYSYSVPMPFSGLSVSLPAGEGWQQLEHWKYKDGYNFFYLAGWFKLQPGRNADVFLEWEYMLAEKKGPVDEKVRALITDELGGAIIDEGVANLNGADMFWARFARHSREKDGIVGIAELEFGRYLTLIIYTEETDMLLAAFKGAVATIEYNPNNLANDGAVFVKQLRSTLVTNIVNNNTMPYTERLYLIRKASQIEKPTQLAGFSVERFTETIDNGQRTGITVKGLQCISGQNGWTNEKLFDCNNNFSEFTWQNNHQINGMGNPIFTKISVGKQRVLTINQSSKKFRLSPFCIPEILVEFAASEFIEFDKEVILIDILIHNGYVIPAVMSKRTITLQGGNEQGHEVRLDLLYDGHTYEEMTFNNNKDLIKKTSKGKELLETEKSDWDELLLKFGKWTKDFERLFPREKN